MNKKIITFLVMIVFTLVGFASAYSSEYYNELSFSFEHETPSSVKVITSRCTNSICSHAVPISGVEYYSGDASVCRTNLFNGGSAQGYKDCMNSFKISTSNTVDVNLLANNNVFVKYPQDNAFGYISNMYSVQDNYISRWYRAQQTCAFDICVYPRAFNNHFERKDNVIAEIGQVNIVNTENRLGPVQITIPLEIEETVCSAFRSATDKYKLPVAPHGHDDYSADTRIDFEVRNENTDQVLHTDASFVSIEADTCVALAEFDWTPAANLENAEIRFTLSTEVIDAQVDSSLIDTYTVVETVYPNDLTNTCSARIEDFTLSNIPTFTLNPSIAQITQGEALFATFLAGAFRDSGSTPMNYNLRILFNGAEVSNTLQSTPSQNLVGGAVDLTNQIQNLAPGSYTVTLEATPSGAGCTIADTVVHNQNLQILEVETFDITFTILDEDAEAFSGANVNLELIDDDDFFVVDPVFNEDLTTNSNGRAVFTDVIRGDYTYVINAPGFESITRDIYVGSDMSIQIMLSLGNRAPVIDMPSSFSETIGNSIVIDIRDYIYDFNDAYTDLQIDHSLVDTQGNGISMNLDVNGFIYTFTSHVVDSARFDVTVTDPDGARDSDSSTISFTQPIVTNPTNNPPVIVNFAANPSSGGAPLVTTFTIQATDADLDTLTCTLDFGDSLPNAAGPCNTLNGVLHVYGIQGTYTATLTVSDGTSSVTETVTIVVGPSTPVNNNPSVNSFTATPNIGLAPLNTVFDAIVSDIDGDNLGCTINPGDGSPLITTNCNSGTLSEPFTYNTPGTYTATLTVSDGNGGVTTFDITVVVQALMPPTNNLPSINIFTATPTVGTGTLTSTFGVAVSDLDGDSLTCTLSFGDGNSAPAGTSCAGLNGITHTYLAPGVYNAILTVSDGTGNSMQTIVIIVNPIVPPANNAPIITVFTATPPAGLAPLSTVFGVAATDADLDPLTCTLNPGDGGAPFVGACNTLNGQAYVYNTPGVYTATLTASDGITSDVQTLTITVGSPGPTFVPNSTLNTTGPNNIAELVVDSVITPGEFDFSIIITNETLAMRDISIRPTIVCSGLEIRLKENQGVLSSSAASSSFRPNRFAFTFNVDTERDFVAKIPQDTNCIFRVNIFDAFGTSLTLEQNVRFSFTDDLDFTQSIRGHDVDIMNFLQLVLNEGVNRGYNIVSFNVVNNDISDGRELSITVMSSSLGFSITEDERLSKDTSREIQMPIYVPKDTKTGQYPVRISVYDGTDHQTRYTYINVN